MAQRSYHHGDLRTAVLNEAATVIDADGVDALSLRGLARRAGVSHAAPAHHFGDRRGLLTALATQGFGLLADALAAKGTDFRGAGVAYVRFALARPAHFTVMFRADLLDTDDETLRAAQERAFERLVGGAAAGSRGHSRADTALAAWSMMHGFASLWLDGALTGSRLAAGRDPEELANEIAGALLE